MFEKRMLRKIFGPKRKEVTEGWRKLHNEELHDLCCSTNIIQVTKSRRVRWAGHVENTRRNRMGQCGMDKFGSGLV
jgi:hypothetical protein